MYSFYNNSEDGLVSGRNIQEVIVCKNYFTILYNNIICAFEILVGKLKKDLENETVNGGTV